MLNIFICEDNLEQRTKITKFVQDIITIENFDMKITLSTANPYEIIDWVKADKASGLYFLDIDLKCEIDGIQLAERIREYDARGFIIFITTISELQPLTFKYKVEALDYIIKDDYLSIQQRIRECVINVHQKYISRSNELNDNFVFRTKDKLVVVKFNEIYFFETSHAPHRIILHAARKREEFYGKLTDVEKLLNTKFYRCHNSAIVNTERIKKIDYKESNLILDGDITCPVATRLIRKISKIIKKRII